MIISFTNPRNESKNELIEWRRRSEKKNVDLKNFLRSKNRNLNSVPIRAIEREREKKKFWLFDQEARKHHQTSRINTSHPSDRIKKCKKDSIRFDSIWSLCSQSFSIKIICFTFKIRKDWRSLNRKVIHKILLWYD